VDDGSRERAQARGWDARNGEAGAAGKGDGAAPALAGTDGAAAAAEPRAAEDIMT
jgi:hypothetical protein